jgi:hypothetical protein
MLHVRSTHSGNDFGQRNQIDTVQNTGTRFSLNYSMYIPTRIMFFFAIYVYMEFIFFYSSGNTSADTKRKRKRVHYSILHEFSASLCQCYRILYRRDVENGEYIGRCLLGCVIER